MATQDKLIAILFGLFATAMHMLGYFGGLEKVAQISAFVLGSITAGNGVLFVAWKKGYLTAKTRGNEGI